MDPVGEGDPDQRKRGADLHCRRDGIVKESWRRGAVEEGRVLRRRVGDESRDE